MRTRIVQLFATFMSQRITNSYIRTGISRNLTTKGNVKSSGNFKIGLLGITAGALVGTGYSIHKLNEANEHIVNEKLPLPIIEKLPDIKPSRKVVFPNDTSGLKLTLYQYQTCPFCCKVRAFLDYHGISYDVVEVNPVLQQSIRWSNYKKVPILLAKCENGYQQLNDSTMIISALSSYMLDTSQSLSQIIEYYPNITFIDDQGKRKSEIMNKYFLMYHDSATNESKNKQIMEERKWRQWVDDKFVHVLSPNVYRTPKESLQAFEWFSEAGDWNNLFPSWERSIIVYVGAFAMWVIGKQLKSKYNLKEDVRCSFYDECDYWMRSIKKKGTTFMGGDEPNLADLAVYGVLNSIQGCDAFNDLLNNTKIGPWYKQMQEKMQLKQA